MLFRFCLGGDPLRVVNQFPVFHHLSRSPSSRPRTDAGTPTLHAVALKYLLAGMAQSGAVLLQTLLNREIIRQLLSAEATSVSPAGRQLLRCALVTLRKRKRWIDQQQDDDSGRISSGPPSAAHETPRSISSREDSMADLPCPRHGVPG